MLAPKKSCSPAHADATTLPQQQLTAVERLTDDQVRAVDCVFGMKPNPDIVAGVQRESRIPGVDRGRARVFSSSIARARSASSFSRTMCRRPVPTATSFYDGGSRALDQLYVRVLGEGTPVVSTYGEFLHRRPSQMPSASGHAIGNSNAVKADVLFDFLRDRVLPPLLPETNRGTTRPETRSRSSAFATNMNTSGCTVTVYRMLVSTGAIVTGTYRIKSSGSQKWSRARHAATTPATKSSK